VWFCALLFAVLGSTAPVGPVGMGSTTSVGLAGRELALPVGLAGEMPTAPTWAGPKKCGLIPKARAGPKNAGQPKESSPKVRTGPNNSGQPQKSAGRPKTGRPGVSGLNG